MNIETTLILMDAEKQQAEIRLAAQIKSIKNTLNNLELRVSKGEDISESEGLQGNGDILDVYLTKLATYQKVIKQIQSIKEIT